LIGLTSLHTENPPMSPKLNRRRALFVLGKIDEILAWEQRKETERDTKFVELGRYLCDVRAGQYWRVENVKSFDEFLERRFPESRRKAAHVTPRRIAVEVSPLMRRMCECRRTASSFSGQSLMPDLQLSLPVRRGFLF
jgi:hypothetical protein